MKIEKTVNVFVLKIQEDIFKIIEANFPNTLFWAPVQWNDIRNAAVFKLNNK